MDPLVLRNHTAVITGGARGIGYAIAEEFAALGANLVINDLSPQSAETAARTLADQHRIKALGVAADVSKKTAVDQLVKKTLAAFPQVHLLVNNAGITRDALLLRMSEAQWDEVLAVNLKSAYLMSQAFFKLMFKQRQGRIINIASVVGLAGNLGQANYSASKGGLIAFTKTAALEGAPRNVLVNAIAPGFIETPMTDALPAAAKAQLLSQIPLKRLGSVKDIANAAAFLAHPNTSYLTGQVLNVNGGLLR